MKSHKQTLAIVLLLYCVAAIVLVPLFQYNIKPDGTAYISVARKYAAGDFDRAVNGYWSPLFSWLIAPLIRYGLPGMLALRLVTLAAGFLALIGAYRLSFRFHLTDRLRTAALLVLVPVFLSYSFTRASPDLLLLCLLLCYLGIAFDVHYSRTRWSGLACGILGGVSYLAKSYALPLFCLHFSLVNLCHFLRASTFPTRKRVIMHTAIGFITFAVVAAPWIAVLSARYDSFTLGTAGPYNWGIRHPDLTGSEAVEYLGFLVPANETDISAWDDSSLLPTLTWSPLSSLDYSKHFVLLILRNAAKTLFILTTFSVLAIPVLLAGLLILFRRRRALLSLSHWYFPLGTVAIYPLGYLLLCVTPQYIWVMGVLILFMGGQLFVDLADKHSRLRTTCVITLCCLTFVIYPVKNALRNLNKGTDIHAIARSLAGEYDIGGRVASHNEYRPSLYLAYFLSCFRPAQYYGLAAANATDEELGQRLAELNVDYYLLWGTAPHIPPFLDPSQEIAGSRFKELRVFSLHRPVNLDSSTQSK